MTEHPDRRQIDAVVQLIRAVIGSDLVGAYLHGSSGAGLMRPSSDLDVLAICRQPTRREQRRALVDGLLEISGRRARRPGRPVELTLVLQGEVSPWRYPPVAEFQYGEWLRENYQDGLIPGPQVQPDLALLVAVALQSPARPLVGPPATEILDPVPHADIRRATLSGVPALLDDVGDDTRNVLLTLARVWNTLATGEIRSKDAAAQWALGRLPAEHRKILAAARSDYLGDRSPAWADAILSAMACARHLASEIEQFTGGGS